MEKTFEITAKFAGIVSDGAKVSRVTWRIQAKDMWEAITKARTYIHVAEVEERSNCVWMGLEEAE